MKMQRMGAVLVLILGALASRADAGFSGIVAFGDSLTDTGNVSIATGGVNPPSSYFNGQFSNGPVWIETLAQGLGVAVPAPSLRGGTNYAFGGAETTSTGLSSEGTPNIGVQVDLYLASNPTITASQLFVVWGGANDLLHQASPSPTQSVANLIAEITSLARAGAREFLVPNLPSLGQTPVLKGSPFEGALDGLTLQFNARLAASLDQLALDEEITIHQLDINGLFQNLLANPGQYGLTNVTDRGISAGTGVDPNTYLFWDDVHPTGTVHRLIGEAALDVLAVPEPSSFLLVGLGLAGCSFVAAKRRR